MKQMSLARWIDWDIYWGDGRRAYIGGREIECITFCAGERYDGVARILFVDADEYVAFPDRYAVIVDCEDDFDHLDDGDIIIGEGDCPYCGQSRPLCDCRYAEPETDEKDVCPCCFAPRHSCGCDGSGCEKSERAQVVEEAIAEDAERQNANDEKNCRAEMETLAAWRPRRRWRRIISVDTPIPYELTPKALAVL